MSESREEAHLSVLTDAEREALERPGLLERSRAIVAITELATRIGLHDDAHKVLVERLRGLGKDDAELAWQTIGNMNELLLTLEVDLTTGSEQMVVIERIGSQASVESVRMESLSEPVTPEPGVELVVESLSETQTPTDTASIAEALDQLIEHEDHAQGYKIERVESVMDQLRRGGVELPFTAEDFRHDTLKQLALMYAEATKADPGAVRTNIACTWGWLSGIDMSELVIWRRSTKPDAKAVDVHNSRTSFLNGVIKGWKKGLRPVFEHLDDDEHVDSEDETTKAIERPVDEEPRHIQVVNAYVEKLSLDINERAFEELLNPQTRGEFTSAKKIVIEQLRSRVGDISPNGNIINDLTVSARGKSALRRLLGMGFVKHGRPEERTPEPLRDQLRHAAESSGYTMDLYLAMEALLEVLTAKQVLPEAELLSPGAETEFRPLQVVFGEGNEARLA